tara:strand:- start:1436 stop:1723 length:288 start_codon:yes stop_codon:yes gene_type:complete
MATKTKVQKRLSKPEKVTNEELNKIQRLLDNMNRAQVQIGGIEVQKYEMLQSISMLRNQLIVLRDDLKKNYGTDDVNIDTGVINYNKNEQANKKD